MADRYYVKHCRKLKVLVIVHQSLMPPSDFRGDAPDSVPWKAEYDILRTLRTMGHDVCAIGLSDDLSVLGKAVESFEPHIAFNLMEEFNGVGRYDQNVVSYLELLKVPYTGCNPRGLMLARHKPLAKKLLTYHGIPTPDFELVPRHGTRKSVRGLEFPLIVKSATEEASLGISKASVVRDEGKLIERIQFIHNVVGSDALVEKYIDGRELYVGVMGNLKLNALPVWELVFSPQGPRIATERVKFDPSYRKRYGIYSSQAKGLSPKLEAQAQDISLQAYRILGLNGYARMDLRLDGDKIYFIEANPNPHISSSEDFAESAGKAGLRYRELISRILTLGLRWQPEG